MYREFELKGGVDSKATRWVLGAILVCLIWVTIMVLLVRSLVPQAAAGQETTIPEASTPATAPSARVPSHFSELEEAFSSASAQAGERPAGIAGLGVMDVVGNLEHFPLRGGGGGFACAGPVPGEGEATL